MCCQKGSHRFFFPTRIGCHARHHPWNIHTLHDMKCDLSDVQVWALDSHLLNKPPWKLKAVYRLFTVHVVHDIHALMIAAQPLGQLKQGRVVRRIVYAIQLEQRTCCVHVKDDHGFLLWSALYTTPSTIFRRQIHIPMPCRRSCGAPFEGVPRPCPWSYPSARYKEP